MKYVIAYFLFIVGSLYTIDPVQPTTQELDAEIADVQEQIAIYRRRAYFAGQAAGRLMSLDYLSARAHAIEQQRDLEIVASLQERLKKLQEQRAGLNEKFNSGKPRSDQKTVCWCSDFTRKVSNHIRSWENTAKT